MAQWQLELDVPSRSAGARGALYLSIARTIIADIRSGRLVPGQRLPGSRKLATQLSVHRNTVVAALKQLVAEGWLRVEPRSGHVVEMLMTHGLDGGPEDPRSDGSKEERVDTEGRPLRAAFDWSERLISGPLLASGREVPCDVLHLGGGLPDPREAPSVLLSRAYHRAEASPHLIWALFFGHLAQDGE